MWKRLFGFLTILIIAEPCARAGLFGRAAPDVRALRDRPSFVEAGGGIVEGPTPEEVLSRFEPQLEKAAHRCQSAEKNVPGDVIIALTLEDDRLPRFDLDVSR